MSPADCGLTFGHDPHAYMTAMNEIKACDGSVTKRNEGDS